ncbi:hypothetical protein PRIEUP_LOCUS853 [Pristimantis euphronides]
MVAVPTRLQLWKKLIGVSTEDEDIEEEDVTQNSTYNPYYACKNCTGEKFLTEEMSTRTQSIMPADLCYLMTCDKDKISRCQQFKIQNWTGDGEVTIICGSRSDKKCRCMRAVKRYEM